MSFELECEKNENKQKEAGGQKILYFKHGKGNNSTRHCTTGRLAIYMLLYLTAKDPKIFEIFLATRDVFIFQPCASHLVCSILWRALHHKK